MRSLQSEIETRRISKPDRDPYAQEGSVVLAGKKYTSLKAAERKVRNHVQRFMDSPAAQLGELIADWTLEEFGKASDGRVSGALRKHGEDAEGAGVGFCAFWGKTLRMARGDGVLTLHTAVSDGDRSGRVFLSELERLGQDWRLRLSAFDPVSGDRHSLSLPLGAELAMALEGYLGER